MRVPRVASSLVLPVLLLTLPFTTADTSDSHNLQAVVADANRLLSSAQYAEAARAYSQAIGQCHLSRRLSGTCKADLL